jgi:hypothetical protein
LALVYFEQGTNGNMPVGKQRFSDFSPSIKSEKRQNTAALQNVAVIWNANSLAF